MSSLIGDPLANGGKPTFRFGLKSVLLAVTFVALILQFWVLPVLQKFSRFREQQQIESRFIRSGARIDWGTEGIVRVGFNPSINVGDAELQGIERLLALKDLHLALSNVGDSTLKRLKNLRQLEKLNLASTKITDSGLRQLKNLTDLRSLALQGTAVTDQGLPELEHLQNLEILSLDDCPVTIAGLTKLQNALPNTRIVHTRDPKWPP